MRPSHNDSERKQIHVKVCQTAWDAWEAYARREGVTLAALLDAIGHQIAAAKLDGAVPAAREIDADRRKRG